MSLTKKGFNVRCEHCTCVADDGCGGFSVSVPLTDAKSGLTGVALLRCRVTSKAHEVALTDWRDEESNRIKPQTEVAKRLSAALDFVAKNQICGNRNICPSDVVEIVKSHSK